MTPEDLAALHARCFTIPRPWSAAEFAGFLADPLAFLLVEGDAGFLLGRAVAGEAELLTLAVAPEARRRGLGQRLVGRFLYQARFSRWRRTTPRRRRCMNGRASPRRDGGAAITSGRTGEGWMRWSCAANWPRPQPDRMVRIRGSRME